MHSYDPSYKSTVLVVDDAPENLELISAMLREVYKVKVANSGEKALRVMFSDAPADIVLLDVMMPEMDGYEVLKALKKNPKTNEIPIIFLTAKSGVEDEKKGFDLGAVDYITKPPSSALVRARVKSHLSLKHSNDFLRDKAQYLEREVVRRTQEINAIQNVTIMAMASLAETRDPETGHHISRTQHYIKALALRLQSHPRFAHFLTDNNITLLFKSSPLHDIGKVGIPDGILLKPGKLTDAEFEIMKTHTTLGWQAIAHAERSLGFKVEFLTIAKEVALSHQEKWDGSGYPQGLAGDNIPISARLMALVDVYDALHSARVYKEKMSHEDSVEAIWKGKGIHFDPDMVDAFMEIRGQFLEISEEYVD